jgi:hypothetical protein
VTSISLQLRLRGGDGGIRTLGTGLNSVRADVCVSYRESILYPETEGQTPLRRWGKPVQFTVQSKGEWLAILRLKVVSTTPLKRPDCFAPDCVRAAQSKSEKHLRRMGSSKGEWPATFRDSCPCFVARLPSLGSEHEIPIQLDAEILIEEAETTTAKKCWERAEDKARLQTAEHVFPRITASSKQQTDDNKR